MTRKEVKSLLGTRSITNNFSLKTVGFEGTSRQVVTVKDWQPDPKATDIKADFRQYGVIVDFEPAKGYAFCLTSG